MVSNQELSISDPEAICPLRSASGFLLVPQQPLELLKGWHLALIPAVQGDFARKLLTSDLRRGGGTRAEDGATCVCACYSSPPLCCRRK